MANIDEPEDGRQRGPKPSDDDVKILRLIRLREEPFATTTDLVHRTNVGKKQTRNRLNDLVEKGLLKVELVGSTKVYWLSDRGKERLSESVSEEDA